MVSKRTLLAIMPAIFGTLLLIGTIQNWNTPSPELQRAQLDVNAAANSLVDTCFSALQNDDGSLAICDSDLKRVQEQTCESYSEADICKDGRVDQFFLMRENEPTVISEANQQTTVLSISDNVDTKISPAADFRCFEQRFMSWIVAENSYYESYTYIEKEHDQYCDPLNYVYGFEYRMIDVNQVTRWHDEGGYTGIYSEYLFLDDSRIKLGEKEIKTYS